MRLSQVMKLCLVDWLVASKRLRNEYVFIVVYKRGIYGHLNQTGREEAI